jgi:hypothetical protein
VYLRRWALHLHRIWRDLCRRVCFKRWSLKLVYLKVKDDVRTHQERYSLLYVPHNFIIPDKIYWFYQCNLCF